ncbi:MAG: hypothetical protein QOH31_353 [Verrucomicrobiota bacterium]
MPPRNLLHSTRDSHKFIIERAAKLTTALGQSRPNWAVRVTSAFPLLATEERTSPNVSNVPIVLQSLFGVSNENS